MKVCVFLADGFETVEALAVVDVLRRAAVDVITISIKEEKKVMSSHNICVEADMTYSQAKEELKMADACVLPGGMPGTVNLRNHEGVVETVKMYAENGKWIAAICAAPGRILGDLGIIDGKRATCHASVTEYLKNAIFVDEPVVVDENIVTSRGMGTAVSLGLELTKLLVDRETAEKIAKAIHLS